MTYLFDGFPLASRGGVELRILIIARISTVKQDVRSLDDQAALCECYVRDRYPPSPARFDTIQGQGSGETLDRKDLADAEAASVSASNVACVNTLDATGGRFVGTRHE